MGVAEPTVHVHVTLPAPSTRLLPNPTAETIAFAELLTWIEHNKPGIDVAATVATVPRVTGELTEVIVGFDVTIRVEELEGSGVAGRAVGAVIGAAGGAGVAVASTVTVAVIDGVGEGSAVGGVDSSRVGVELTIRVGCKVVTDNSVALIGGDLSVPESEEQLMMKQDAKTKQAALMTRVALRPTSQRPGLDFTSDTSTANSR